MDHRNSRQERPVEEVVAAIQSLELDPIKLKLMDADEGYGWSREHADQMEVAYKRFLTLLVTHPETGIAPTKEIDKFWHGHILDTKKYAEDCQNVFGYFLHHFPYFGMRGEDDAAQLEQASQNMHRIYAEQFGESMPTSQAKAAFCGAEKSAKAAAAFCWAEKPAKTNAAFCWAGKPVNADAAFCWAEKPAKNDAAFCWAEKWAAPMSVDTQTRPTLALAA